MATTPQDVRRLADSNSRELGDAFRDGAQSAHRICLVLGGSDLDGDRWSLLDLATSALVRVREQDLVASTADAPSIGVLSRYLNSSLVQLSRELPDTDKSSKIAIRAARGFIHEVIDSLHVLPTTGRVTNYVFSGPPPDFDNAQREVRRAADLIDDVAVRLGADPSSIAYTVRLAAWISSLLYVIFGAPYSFDDVDHDGQNVVADLEYVPSLGAAFEKAGQMRGEVENLLGKLHQAAQVDGTPDELSSMMTQHARDGHRLFFGSDGEEREVPPLPALVQGWVTGTLELLSRVTDLSPEAEEFVDDLVTDASPSGFRDALNAQLDEVDVPELAAYRSEQGEDLIGNEFVGVAAERLSEALGELLTPDKVGVATGIGWWLAETYHLGPGSYLLSTIIVLALLMRRKPDSDEKN